MHTPETCSNLGCHERGAEISEFHTCTCGSTPLYELVMELALSLERDSQEICPTEDDDYEYDLEDSQQMEAYMLGRMARRIAAILNVSIEADTEGGASSQHYIETGVRLPRDPAGVIRLAATYFLHSEDPEGFDLGVLADALGVDHADVEALE